MTQLADLIAAVSKIETTVSGLKDTVDNLASKAEDRAETLGEIRSDLKNVKGRLQDLSERVIGTPSTPGIATKLSTQADKMEEFCERLGAHEDEHKDIDRGAKIHRGQLLITILSGLFAIVAALVAVFKKGTP